MPFEQLKTSGSAPQTGGELPPMGDPAPQRNRGSLKDYMQSLVDSRQLDPTLLPLRLLMYGWGGKGGGGGKGPAGSKSGSSKPTKKPPATPQQWTFQPSPYDQPNYAVPMGNAAQYTINPPAQQWMFDPATGGQGAPPQWYGQPVVPNSQPPIR